MTPELQLLQKVELPGGAWQVINPPADWFSARLLATAGLYSEEWAVARQLPACEFGLFPHWIEGTENVLLFLPKAKPRLQALLQSLVPTLGSATLWVVGENSGGIKAAPKMLGDYFVTVEKRASAKRCGLLRCLQPLHTLPEPEQLEPVEYADWKLAALPGLFNKGQVDKGTQLLLQHLPVLRGHVLDMGCGGGVISLAAMKKGADSVLAVDSSAVALEATKASLALNNVAKVEVMASDVFSDIPRDIGGSFDWVISNPPFHSGIATDYQPAQRLIQDSKRYIRSGGRLMIVANRHLPYEQWLESTFSRWEVLVQESGFKLLVAYQ